MQSLLGSIVGLARQKRVLGLALVGFVGFGAGGAYGAWTRACAGQMCPSIAVLGADYVAAQSAKVLAADGRLIKDLGAERRTVLKFGEISPEVRAAFLAAEDKRFYSHNGIDYYRVLGAMWHNVLALRYAEGFSTISMQLARNIFPERLTRAKAPKRKLREAQVALEIEHTYSKDKIFEMYLNQIYLGNGANGVEAAAQRYFGKSARILNVAEAALLAGINQRPSRYDPRTYPARATRRRNVVINLMRDQGYLTDAEAERWKAYPIVLTSRQDFGETAPYFVEWIRQQLFDRFGPKLYNSGYRIYTTLDLDMQLAAERSMSDQLLAIERGAEGPYRHLTYDTYQEQNRDESEHTSTPYLQGALVSMEAATGHVLAMVGGRNFDDSKFNRATQARRQTGSTFKPFVYAAAVQAGKPLSYMVDDAPISIPQSDTTNWEPQDFEPDFLGPMTMRRGLATSRNLVAVHVGLELGVPAVVGMAVRFGLTTPIPRVPSIFIGSAAAIPLEMVSAFTAFATLGNRAAAIGILRVEDAKGNIVWQPPPRLDRVMDQEHIWLVNSMMQDVLKPGGTAYNRVRVAGGFTPPAAGKTGTTNDGTDVWFIGFTPEIVTGVWMGLDTPSKIKADAQGGKLAAPAWAAFMREVYERRVAPADWVRPDSLISREVDNTTGFLANQFCPRQVRYFEWYIPGTEPTDFCPIHKPFSLVPGRTSPAEPR
jgi:penicillin-binding protein 1A